MPISFGRGMAQPAALLLQALFMLLLSWVTPECINGCSGHGKCSAYDMCMCYRNWQSNDCSERVCQFGISFVDAPKGDLDSSGSIEKPDDLVTVNSFVYPYGTSESYPNLYDSRGVLITQSGHAYAECSNSGVCNRQTGECECQEGFEGVACQRLTCPGYPGYHYGIDGKIKACSGHGQCRTITSIVRDSMQKEGARDSYKLWDKQLSTACVCDPGFHGGDCHMRSCKKDVDPLYLDDFALVSYGRYYFSFLATSPNATFSDGASGQAYFRLRVFDSMGEGWLTERIDYPATCSSLTAALAALPHRLIDTKDFRCAVANIFKKNPLAHENSWNLHSTSRWKMYFNTDPRGSGNGVKGARDFYSRVNPVFWTQFPRGYSYKTNSSWLVDGTLTGSVFLLEFNGNVGDIPQPEVIVYSDGQRSTIVPSQGHLFTNVWTDGQRAEATDYFSNLCPKLSVRVDSSNPNYHFLTGFVGREKVQLMECLEDADFDPSNNVLIPGTGAKPWDYGTAFYPHIVRMVRMYTDVVDSGFYVALYYDTSVTGLDGGQGYGDTLGRGMIEGTFKLLHPFESLDHFDEVLYYIYTTKGTLQVAGNKTEAVFDFASKEFYTTNQSHIIDYGVYWRVNETQTVELSGSDVDEVQVVQTALESATNQPEVQTVTVKALRNYAVQEMGVIITGTDVANRLANCNQGVSCPAFHEFFSGEVRFRFNPNNCGANTKVAKAGNPTDANFCLKALATLSSNPITSVNCSLSVDCVSPLGVVTFPLTTDKIKSGIENIEDHDEQKFMIDASSGGVTVTDTSAKLSGNSYRLSFKVTFVGKTVQGDVPTLTIYSSTGAYTKSNGANTADYYTYNLDPLVHTSLITGGAGTGRRVKITGSGGPKGAEYLPTTNIPLLVIQRGNQPDGYYKLSYTCPAKWTLEQVTASKGTATGDHMTNSIQLDSSSTAVLRVGHVMRVLEASQEPVFGQYHRVVSLDSSCTYSSCKKATVSPPINTKISSFVKTVELGVFYSDPLKVERVWQNDWRNLNPFGVSEACRLNNKRWTDLISVYDSDTLVKSKLVTIMAQLVPSATTDALISWSQPDISVTRTTIDLHSACTYQTDCYIGYVYTVTFVNAHGDGLPLGVKSADVRAIDVLNIWPTTTLGPAPTVTVDTLQDGAMIYDGYFALSQTYPHSYVGTPQSFTANDLRWNAADSDIKDALSAIQAFGNVAVTRSGYAPTGDVRWTGGYMWTITFKDRNGQLPKMTIVNSLIKVDGAKLSGVTRANTKANVGTESAKLSVDDPGVAVTGNQISGSFGFSFTDPLGNLYSSSPTDFNVVSSVTGMALSADEFRDKLRTMLGNKRITAVKVTRSTTPNAVMGFTYTVEFQGKDLRGNVMSLQPITSSLTKTATMANSDAWIAVSETSVGRNDTVYNSQYDGEIGCETHGGPREVPYSACLSKGDFFFVLDPYNPTFNPPYLNMHRAVSVYTQDDTPFTPGLSTLYPEMSLSEKERLWTFKRFVVKSDLASNWAQDTTGQATFRFYKFHPHKDSTYRVVTECSNRGTCNTFEGVCDCFHGYTGDSCSIIESMAV